MRTSRPIEARRLQTRAWVNLCSTRVWVTLHLMRVWRTPHLNSNASLSNSVSRPTRVWGTSHLIQGLSNPASHFKRRSEQLGTSTSDAGLRNPASYFRRESEKPCVSLQTRVWATPRSSWDARVYNKQREIRVQHETRVSIVTDLHYWVN